MKAPSTTSPSAATSGDQSSVTTSTGTNADWLRRTVETYGADVLHGSIHRRPHLPLLPDFGLPAAFCVLLFGVSLRNIRRRWVA